MKKPTRPRRPLIEAIEPRLLFSATADIALFDDGSHHVDALMHAANNLDLTQVYLLDNTLLAHSDHTYTAIEQPNTAELESNNQPHNSQVLAPEMSVGIPPERPTDSQPPVFVFVDTSIDNYETLVEDIRNNNLNTILTVVFLDPSQDGVETISQTLAQTTNVSAIHILSHGIDGNFKLGNQLINENTIGNYRTELSGWSNSFSKEADILIYGCDVAENDAGLRLIQSLSIITGADVAASNDDTGNAVDADWVLEAQSGKIETATVLTGASNAQWEGTLPNSAPTVASLLVDQVATKGSAFSYAFNSGTFNDVDGDTLTYTATKQDGSALPGWLTFTPGTRTFSGTPSSVNDVAAFTVRVTANDGNGGTVYDDFVVQVKNIIEAEDYNNMSGVVTEATTDTGGGLNVGNFDTNDWFVYYTGSGNPLLATTGTYTIDFRVASATGGTFWFSDADNRTTNIVTTVNVANTGGWQNWQTYSFTQNITHYTNYGFTGVSGNSNVNWFQVTPNDAPTISHALVDKAAYEDTAFSYQFNAQNVVSNVFDDSDALTYSATLSGGGALPSWLSFNAGTRTFSGTPVSADIGSITVRVTASDGSDSVYDDFIIVTAGVNDAPAGTDKTININEDTPYTFTVSDFGFSDVNDSPANSLAAVRITSLPAAGTFKLNGTDVIANQTVTVADINAGLLVFAPASNAYNAVYYTNLTFQVQDDGGTSNGGVDLDPSSNVITFTVTAVNDTPSGTNATLTTLEDTGYTFSSANFGFTDTDSGDTISAVRIDSLPAAGTLTLSGTPVVAGDIISTANIGNLVFTPASNANGASSASFTFSVRDQSSGYDTTPNTITFDVTAVNDAPSGTDATYAIARNGSRTLAAADFGFSDIIDSNSLAGVKITTLPGAGSLTLSGSGVALNQTISAANIASGLLVYTPVNGASGTAYSTIGFKVQDNGGTTNSGIDLDSTANVLTFDVIAPPTVLSSIPQQSFLEGTFYTPDFTAFFSGSPTSYTITVLGGPGLANFSFNTTTSVLSGTPLQANVGTTQLRITATNMAGSVFSDFDMVVNDSNVAPVAVADTVITLNEGGTATTLVGGATSVLTNDTDADGNPLTAILVSNVSNGSLTLNSDGTFNYTHNGGETTTDSFTYKVNDGTVDGNTVTVNINITSQNDAPVATGETVVTVNEGGTATTLVGGATSVLTNDTDADGNPLTAILVSNVTNGSLTLNANGTFSYTHNGGETTTDSFTYKVNDGTVDGNTVTVSINITPVNDTPVATGETVVTVNEGGTATTLVGGATSVLTNDTDADGNPLTAILVSNVTNGSLTLNADGTFSYTHNGGETTTDSFTYKVNDGTVDGNTVTVSINITPQNDAPVAVADTVITLNEGATATTLAGGATSVLTNDTDADGNPLIAILVTNVTNGSLTLNANGTFSYTHNGGETTTDSFTYKVNDGTVDGNTVTVNINITSQNDAPVATGETVVTVNEGGTATTLVGGATSVLTNDTDADGNPLTAILVSNVTNGSLTLNSDGTFIYTHNGGETTTDSFTYKVNDGTVDGNTVTVSINITPVNDAPVATGETIATVNEGGTATTLVGGATSVLTNDTDADGNPLTAILVSNVTNGSLTLNSDGTFSYTHNGGETTTDSFTYKVNDGTVDGNTVTVSINITPQNDAPVATGETIVTVNEGGTATTLVGGATSVLTNDTDADGNPLTAILVSNVSNGSLTLNANGTFSYTHNGGETTTDGFTYKVNDGTVDGNTVTVNINVTPVNDAPVAVADTVITLNEGATATTLVGGATSVLTNDTDADGNPLTAILVSNVTNGSLTLNSDGTFSYTHNGGETTTDSFTYKVNDGTVDGNTVTVSINITPVNDAPIATGETVVTVNEGGTATTLVGGATSVLTNDTDADGNPLTAILVSNVTNGSLTLNANGTFSYTHNSGETTTDSFTYKVNDGTVDGNTVTVSINITPQNDAPVAVADTVITLNEGATATSMVGGATSVLSNDTDADGNPFTSILVSNVSNGSLTLNANGTFTYTHNGGETTTDSFTYKVNDGTVDGNTVTVSINITPVNDAPVAVTDTVLTVNEGGTATTLVGGATSVLTNDTDADGNPLTAILVSNVSNGSLTLNANGTFSYTHNGGETTTDGFTYKVNDGTVDGNTVTVNINVTPVNDAPVAVADTVITLNEGATATTLVGGATSVLTNDTDADGNPLTAILVSNVTNGSLTLNADGTFSYTHNGGETTTDSFTYKVNDGTVDGNTVTVSINITPQNDAPVAVADTVITLNEGATATTLAGGATSVLTNDTDADGNPLIAILVTNVTNGSLTLNANGTFSYTHNGGETTTDSFTYKANDGTVDGNTVTVSINITPQNDAPVATGETIVTVNEGGTATTLVGGATSVLTNDNDADGNPLTAILVSNVTNGSLTLNSDGTFSYTHNGGETTTDSFTYKVNDGTVDGNTVTVSINITPVNDAPVAVTDTVLTVNEGGTATTLVGGATSVLTNDTDADGNPLTAILVTDVANGNLTLNADGTFSYTHNGDETTTDSFTYKVNDGTVDGNTVTVSINITPVNDAPVAVADTVITLNEGGTATTLVGGATSVLTNDTDADGNLLTAILVSNVTNGSLTLNSDGTFSYTHNGGETTTDSFTYKVNDGTVDGNTVTVSINITPVNDAPVAVTDTVLTVNEGGTATTLVGGATSVLTNDTDADGNPLTAILVTDVANGSLTLNANGTFSYTHNSGETTTDSFTYKVNDGTVDGNTVTVSINITPVNDAPIATGETVVTVNEGGTATTLVGGATSVLTNDTDADGNPLTAILVSNVTNGSLTLNANGTFTYTHNGGETTTDSFTYKVNDGTVDGNTVTVSINITPVNDAPVAVADTVITLNEGGTATTLVGGATSVLTNDTDADGNPLTAILVSNVTNGSLTLNANGTFTYTHNGGETTTDSFTYKVNDGTVDGNTVTVSINITPANDAPVATGETVVTLNEGGTATTLVGGATSVLTNDTDADGNPLTAILVSNVTNGSLTLNADGTFSYTHNGGETTTDSFTYKVNDGTVDGNTVTVSINITPQNDAPIAVAETVVTVNEGATATTLVGGATSVLTNDTDADGNPLTAILVSNVTNGSLTLNSNGTFSYTHNGGETTTDSFTYKVNDGTVDGNTVTVNINITPQNDAPVAVADTVITLNEGATATTLAGGATSVLTNDTDADGNPLTAILVSNVTNGSLTLNSDGTFSYTHNGGETTTDSFTYKVNDGTFDGNTVTVSINITPQNDAPIAVAETIVTVNEGGTATTLVGGATSVLTNDTDADGNPLTAILVSNVTNGSLTLNSDGTFSYTHNGGETTTDSFTYKVNDGTVDGNTVTVSINITPLNDAPIATGETVVTVNEGGTATTLVGNATSVLTNDTDADGNPLTAILVSNVANGSLTLNANGTFSYTHNGGETTTDSFTYKVNDGTVDGNTVTVSINITPQNDAPVATGETVVTVNEGGTETTLVGGATSVLTNDTDADGNPLTAILVSNVTNGSLTLNANGTFTYTHNGGETTTDSFTYKVNDGTVDGNTVTVSINITPQNDAPVATGETIVTVNEGGTATTLAGGATSVLTNDTDADGNPLTAILVSNVTNGSLTLNSDGTFSYTHNGGETTTDSFTYKVNDGTVDGNTVTVSINITPVNDAPVATGETLLTVNEGATATTLVGGATSVLTNDTDADGNPLTAILVSNVTNGSLTLNSNGTFIYTHNGGETTTDSFTYKVNDGTVDGNTVTVSIAITPVNDAPVATGESVVTVNEGATATTLVGGTTSVLTNDTDADGNPLTAILVSNVTNGSLTLNADGTFSYTHNGGETTTDSFTYKVNDGTVDGNTVTVSINITPANDAPVATGETVVTLNEGGTATTLVGGATSVLTNDTDADGNPLTAILVSNVANGNLTLNADGTFSYTHNGGETTTDSFTYKVNDGTVDGNTVTMSINITPVNDAPVATGETIVTVNEGGTATTLAGGATSVLTNDTDADGNPLTAILVSNVTNGSLTLNSDGTFSYTHNGGETTTDSFTYKVNDGTVDGNTVTVSINITPVNDAPVATGETLLTVNEGATATTLVGGATSVLTNDTDADGNPLTAILVSNVTNGSLTLNSNGTFIYTHNGGETTTDSFTYKVNDGTVDGNTVTVNINITPQNDAPVVTNNISKQTALENIAFTFKPATNIFSDSDASDALIYSAQLSGTTSLPNWLTFDPLTQTFSGIPTANDVGDLTLELIATDSQGQTASTIFTLHVAAKNQEPNTPTNNDGGTTEPTKPNQPTDNTGNTNNTDQATNTSATNNNSNTNNTHQATTAINGHLDNTLANNIAATAEELLLLADKTQTENSTKEFDHNRYDRIAEQQTLAKTSNLTLNLQKTVIEIISPSEGFSAADAAEFTAQVKKVHNEMAEKIDDEHRHRAIISGVILSVTTGVIIWSLRASSLLLALMSMLPLWRGIDPLPILEEVEKRKKELEKQRKDKKNEDTNTSEVGYLFDKKNSNNTKE